MGASVTEIERGKKLLVLVGRGFMRGYSGTQYLLDALHRRGSDLDVIVLDQKSNRKLYADLAYPVQVYSPMGVPGMRGEVNTWLRNWANPMLWDYVRRYRNSQSVLVCEGEFSAVIKLGQWLYPRIPVFHFCQELELASKAYYWKSYRALTEAADGFLDVEPHRAGIRARLLGRSKPYWILPNSLPLKDGVVTADASLLADILARKGMRPLLIYTGTVGNADKPFSRLLEIVARVRYPVAFVAILGNVNPQQLVNLQVTARRMLSHVPHQLLGPQARRCVISSLPLADVGLIDYAYATCPTENQRYCAPTKFFEYMAAGLALVTSDNPSLRDIIEKEQLGGCAANDDIGSFSAAIDVVLSNPDELALMKLRARAVFVSRYCFDVVGEPVVSELLQMMNYLHRSRSNQPESIAHE